MKYLSENEKKAVLALKKEVLKLDKKAKLIIYGSKVRGDFDEESDIDVLIILNNPLELKYKILDIATEIELNYDVVFGIMIISQEEFQNSNIFRQSLYFKNIKSEGIYL